VKLDCKSSFYYIVLINESFILWKLHETLCVTLSITKVEYVVMCEGVKEILFIKNLFKLINMKVHLLMNIYFDLL
jgi:hypothetical protein